jgi:hypothetical protein
MVSQAAYNAPLPKHYHAPEGIREKQIPRADPTENDKVMD